MGARRRVEAHRRTGTRISHAHGQRALTVHVERRRRRGQASRNQARSRGQQRAVGSRGAAAGGGARGEGWRCPTRPAEESGRPPDPAGEGEQAAHGGPDPASEGEEAACSRPN
jgi:hypothetical protein